MGSVRTFGINVTEEILIRVGGTVVTALVIVTVVGAVVPVVVVTVVQVTVMLIVAVVTEVAVALLFLKQEVILQIQTVVLPKIIMMLFNLVMHNFLLKSLECCFFK